MNKFMIIGNLTRAPEVRQVNGVTCCNFTVAVDRRVKSGDPAQTDFVRVTAWRQLGENCAKYLDKGRKVYAEGQVRAHGYTADGEIRAQLEMNASDVKFLSPARSTPQPAADSYDDMTEDDLSFA